MSIAGIENVLSQLRGAAAAAGTELASFKGSVAAQSTGEASFAGELKRSLDKVSDAQESAGIKAQQFELGAPNVSLNDVMVDMQKANIGFQMSLQVRNKLVTAYQDIMNMQA